VRGSFAEKMAAFTQPTTDQEYSPTRQYIGLVCGYAREQAGLTQKQLGQKIRYVDSLIAHIEAGRRMATPEFLDAAEAALPSRGLLSAATTLLATVDHTLTRRAHPELECEAIALHYWAPQIMPLLLQTEDYARALCRHRLPPLDDEQTRQAMDAWRDQQMFVPGDERPLLTFVLDEAVLRRHVGGAAVMHEQLMWLLEWMEQSGVTLQIAPQDDAYYPALPCPTVIVEHTKARVTAYIEGHAATTLVYRGEHVGPLVQHFGHLRGYALSPEASARLIRDLAWKLTVPDDDATGN
jgi:transcriptional regulator with XRE-family HTH domain